MEKFLLTVMILISPHLRAEVIQDQVHSVQGNLLRFRQGRVAFLDKKHFQLNEHELVRVRLDERSSVIALEKISENNKRINFHLLEEVAPDPAPPLPEPVFEPTVVQGMTEASRIFNAFNPYYKRLSECSERAHYWAHSEFKNTGIKSLKAFVFFTASYINSVRFKWWFHVAPMYKVNDGGVIKDLVMDYRYTDHPISVKEWTDRFVYTKRPCKITTRFSEYDVNPQTENCYLMFESMHYKVPQEISAKESGRYKTKTYDSEVTASFRYAFDR